jgi:hypothetical protein
VRSPSIVAKIVDNPLDRFQNRSIRPHPAAGRRERRAGARAAHVQANVGERVPIALDVNAAHLFDPAITLRLH